MEADIIPAIEPITTAKIIENTASSKVQGNLCSISLVTYSSEITERPRSPRRAPLSQIKYWVGRGLFKPYFSRMALMVLALACGPAITIAGSPGAKRIKEKARIETPNNTGIIINNRLVIYHFIYYINS
ncbi:hypothetical protein ES708_31620 [subsurface metagenome]